MSGRRSTGCAATARRGRHAGSDRTIGAADTHVSAAGLAVPMHGRIDESRSAAAIIHASRKPTRQLMRDAGYLERLVLDPGRQLVASQCSGALILGASGVLKGCTATTYPTARAHLEAFGVEVVPEPFVAHERVATAAGCLAGIDLDRWIITKLLDARIADACFDSVSPIGEGLLFELDASPVY